MQDRTHVFKLFGSYDLPFGFTLGGFLRVQSGQAWQAMGRTNSYAARYLEPAGSRRLPTWTNFDLLGAYTFNFGQGMSVRIEGRVQNVFNTQTALSVVTQQYNDPYVDPAAPGRSAASFRMAAAREMTWIPVRRSRGTELCRSASDMCSAPGRRGRAGPDGDEDGFQVKKAPGGRGLRCSRRRA